MNNDPALRELVMLTTKYKTTIVVATALVTAAGIGVGSLGPKTTSGIAMVHPAEVAPSGAVENLDVAASRVQTFIESKVMTQALDDGTVLEAIVVRDQPPSSMPINLLALKVKAPNADAARSALELAIEELRRSQDPLHDEERARIEANTATYEKDIARMSAVPVSKASYESVYRAIVDLSESSRWLQPIRTHKLQVLEGPTIEVTKRTPRIVMFGALGFVVGLILGYVLAFVLAGLRAVRAAT